MVQATGKALVNMALQERLWWLNVASLSDSEKDDILDVPIVLEGIFGLALASMQRWCEAKKKEDEALQLCLPRKSPTPPQLVRREAFTASPPALSGWASWSKAGPQLQLQLCRHSLCKLQRFSPGRMRKQPDRPHFLHFPGQDSAYRHPQKSARHNLKTSTHSAERRAVNVTESRDSPRKSTS